MTNKELMQIAYNYVEKGYLFQGNVYVAGKNANNLEGIVGEGNEERMNTKLKDVPVFALCNRCLARILFKNRNFNSKIKKLIENEKWELKRQDDIAMGR